MWTMFLFLFFSLLKQGVAALGKIKVGHFDNIKRRAICKQDSVLTNDSPDFVIK